MGLFGDNHPSPSSADQTTKPLFVAIHSSQWRPKRRDRGYTSEATPREMQSQNPGLLRDAAHISSTIHIKGVRSFKRLQAKGERKKHAEM